MNLKEFKMAAVRIGLGNVSLIDGTLANFIGSDLTAAIGSTIYMVQGANEYSVLPDGKYMTDKNVTFTISNGVLASVNKQGSTMDAPPMKADQIPQGFSKQTKNKSKMSTENKDSLLQSEIEVAYAKSKQNGDNGETLESFSKKYQPTKENNLTGMFDQIAKVRAHNATKETGMSFNAKPATSNLNEKQRADHLAEAEALGIKTFVQTPAEKIIAAKVAEGLSLYVNLTREEEQKIKDKIIAKATAEFEKEKLAATNLKNKLPKDMTPMERILAERGW